MKNILKYTKFFIAFVIFLVLIYGIMATLNHNVSLQKAQAQQAKINPPISFETIVVKKSFTQNPLTLVGVLKPFETLEFLSDTEGKITEVFFDLHQQVTKGQLLAKTDTKIKQTQTNIAELNFKKAKRDFERMEALYKNKNLSEVDFENARFQMLQAEQNLQLNQHSIDYSLVKSPMNGIITQKYISKGKFLQMGSPIAMITDISRLRLVVNVAPQDLPKIQLGAVVPIKIPSQNLTQNLTGTIHAISVQGNEAGSFPIEIMLQNTQNLRAGLQAEIMLDNPNMQRETLLIPRIALVGEDVFVLENDKPTRKKVTLGKEYNENVEILTGLQTGELLIVKGQNNY